MPKTIHNVVAAIIKKNNQYLIAKRNRYKHFALKWEFPGGKVEFNETFEEALSREIKEELNIKIKIHKKIGTENLYTVIGKTTINYRNSTSTVSATSISDISGIPRATCIRKLDKLVSLGLLIREIKTKRYYVNQTASERTKHITQKEYVLSSVEIFSEFLSVIIRALVLAKA